MNIKIELKNGKELYLTNDSTQFIIHDGMVKRTDKDGKESEIMKNAHYYGSFKNAIHGLFTFGLLKSTAQSLTALNKDIRHIELLIKNLHID